MERKTVGFGQIEKVPYKISDFNSFVSQQISLMFWNPYSRGETFSSLVDEIIEISGENLIFLTFKCYNVLLCCLTLEKQKQLDSVTAGYGLSEKVEYISLHQILSLTFKCYTVFLCCLAWKAKK